jgi:hypothetical protein
LGVFAIFGDLGDFAFGFGDDVHGVSGWWGFFWEGVRFCSGGWVLSLSN